MLNKARRTLGLPWLLALFALALWGTVIVTDGQMFELEGDIEDGSPAGTDWRTVNAGAVSSGVRTGVVSDPRGTTIFIGGGSKDTEPISKWQYTSGSVPDKDDITNAYAYAVQKDGALLIFFGADRYTTEGNANFGFWFTQKKVAPRAGSTGFTGEHSHGDLLIVSGYEQGGKVPVIQVYEWMGGPEDGNLVLVSSYTNDVACTGNKTVCAVTNTANINIGTASSFSPAWSYTDKDGGSQVIKPNAFIEGGINVTATLGMTPCFTGFIAETRSSTSETAQLKDFAFGDFNICGLELTKECDGFQIVGGGTQVEFGFKGTVTNRGMVAMENVVIEDQPVGAPSLLTVNVGTLAPGESKDWNLKYTAAATSVENTARARGVPAGFGATEAVVSETIGPVSCAAQVNPAISVSKTCSTSLEVNNGQVVVKVDFAGTVTNTGSVNLSDLSIGHFPAGATLALSKTSLAPGESTTYSGSYYPAGISLSGVPGRYFFSDWVFVSNATPALGAVIPDTTCSTDPLVQGKACAQASCPICPGGSCPTGN